MLSRLAPVGNQRNSPFAFMKRVPLGERIETQGRSRRKLRRHEGSHFLAADLGDDV